jgi:hypothetical protein
MAALSTSWLRLGVAELSPQRAGDTRWHELIHFATQHRNLFNQTRTEVRELFNWSQEDSLQSGFQFPVHQGHLEFELEVTDGAQAANDRVGFVVQREFDKEPLEFDDFYIPQVANAFREQEEPLLNAEEGTLLIVKGDGDDDFVEEPGRAAQNIEVSVVWRVERAGVDGAAHLGCLAGGLGFRNPEIGRGRLDDGGYCGLV